MSTYYKPGLSGDTGNTSRLSLGFCLACIQKGCGHSHPGPCSSLAVTKPLRGAGTQGQAFSWHAGRVSRQPKPIPKGKGQGQSGQKRLTPPLPAVLSTPLRADVSNGLPGSCAPSQGPWRTGHCGAHRKCLLNGEPQEGGRETIKGSEGGTRTSPFCFHHWIPSSNCPRLIPTTASHY